MPEGKSGSRFTRSLERVMDSSSGMHVEEEIEIAHPRVEIAISEVPKPRYNNLLISRIVEVRDKTILLDDTIAPPVLICHAHPVPMGWARPGDRLGGNAAGVAGALCDGSEFGWRIAGV